MLLALLFAFQAVWTLKLPWLGTEQFIYLNESQQNAVEVADTTGSIL